MSTRLSEFNNTIIRIFHLLILLWNWLRPKPAVKNAPAIKYSEKYLSQFAKFLSQSPKIKDANIEPVIKDADALAEALSVPDNVVETRWKRRILIEHTPRGNLFMFYDVYKKAFSYYCDQAVIPYDILNAVAMKYVMTFKCCYFFVDSQILSNIEKYSGCKAEGIQSKSGELCSQEFEKYSGCKAEGIQSKSGELCSQEFEKYSGELCSEVPKESATTTKQNNPSLNKEFAKFKSYNITSKRSEVAKGEDKQINRFLHLGQVRNWSIIDKPKRVNPLNGFKTDLIPKPTKLSYKDFKSLKF